MRKAFAPLLIDASQKSIHLWALGLRFPLQGLQPLVTGTLLPALRANWDSWRTFEEGEIHRIFRIFASGGAGGTGKTTFGRQLSSQALICLPPSSDPFYRALELSVKHGLQLRVELLAYRDWNSLEALDQLFYEQFCLRFVPDRPPPKQGLKEILLALVTEEPGLQHEGCLPVTIHVDEAQRSSAELLGAFAHRFFQWFADPAFRASVLFCTSLA